MDTRVEIYRDGLWRALRLRDRYSIRYNAVINQIGKISQREISHSNTFALPLIYENITALGLNVFNPLAAAKAFNSKFEARYYVEDKLLKEGFLVINNTQSGQINVNFIDGALSLIEQWGALTYQDLLKTTSITKPSDYQTAIDEMTSYSMPFDKVLSSLSSVGTRGYNLAKYPNNLNTIGDAFQIKADGTRPLDQFNPYQSRPVFNVKAMFDLACESFGYTPEYSPSVDWNRVERTYMVASGLDEGQKDVGGSLISVDRPLINGSTEHYRIEGDPGIWTINMIYPLPTGSYSVKPSDLANWSHPPNFNPGYETRASIYVPDVSSTLGTVRWVASELDPVYTGVGAFPAWDIYSIWKNTVGPGYVFKAVVGTNGNSFPIGGPWSIDYTADKTQFAPSNAPANGGDFVGVIAQVRITVENTDPAIWTILNSQITEELLPAGTIAYDEYGQYLSNNNDLTHAAPQKKIKELMSAYMQKDGILMNVDSISKVVKFFTYGHYQDQKEAGNFSDWSNYLLRNRIPTRNTDYGNSYAKNNRIGLSEPYTGNTYTLQLANQGEDSKYKDNADNLVKLFKDISGILKINNTVPYYEFKNLGLGLVEEDVDIGSLAQVRADGSTQGTLSSLSAMQNVNYLSLPPGVVEWYRLIDSALRVGAFFLLPAEEIRTLDLSEPIYIEELGGFYIIEKISEYVNAQTPVEAKLIKLIDNLKAV